MRPKASTTLALLAALACIAPITFRSALAGAAALLFEAAPFVLAAELIARATAAATPRTQLAGRWLLRLTGCGCGQPAGALSVTALGLCWLAFGPTIALARAALALATALAVDRLRPGRTICPESGTAGSAPAAPSVLPTLASLTIPALAGSLGASLATSLPSHAPSLATFALGAILGSITPCVAGSIAIAAALRNAAPATTAGLLATAGIVALRPRETPARAADQRPALAALGLACLWLVARHGAGLIHPRLLPLMLVAAIIAATLALRPTPRRTLNPSSKPPLEQWTVPMLMLGVLIAGAPAPQLPRADPTTLADAFTGQPLRFCGMTRGNEEGTTTLVRFLITCCRADATPVGIRLDRRLNRADGTWLEADGTIANDRHGMLLRVHNIHNVTAPTDPFLYR